MANKKNTRNAHGSGTIRQRPDGRWEARCTVGTDPSTGKAIRKSVYGSGQQEVRKKMNAITAAIDNGDYKEPSKLTISEWLDIWIEEYSLSLKPLTVKSYKTQIETHIKPTLGRVKLSALAPHHIQKFYNKLNADYSPKTIKNIHGVLHKGLQQAVILGYIRVNPAEGCKLPKVVKTQIMPMDKTIIPAFLEAIKGHQFENIFIVDLFTGLRQSEIIGLTWDCIDFDAGTIYIYRQYQRLIGSYQWATLKNGKTRLIKPAKLVMDTLKAEKIKQTENRLRAGSAWQNPENFVFTNELGEYVKHPTLLKHYKKVVTGIGYPELRFHDLRHSFAVVSLQAGDDIKTVQENLGHHSASFTMDTYAHVTDAMRKESSERMDTLIQSL
ncbi:tyrosine-type recombinase/integrase [Acetobacterium fimetarium]|uniref:Tyrosine-type recombinase/integrase n=1 Tax=Acetobacterium fimetarium TaxID=52691 RepID=A0ABR6WVE3_9FIRM|nr:tyrosine-type recombinase/integrase [Acetobacterium fimetarium]MBC3804567.1 tyrosine-type recombinase/integrase [Acetobacterium fimetarium]